MMQMCSLVLWNTTNFGIDLILINIGAVLPISIQTAILLMYNGGLYKREQCGMSYEMSHDQFANSEHTKNTTCFTFLNN